MKLPFNRPTRIFRYLLTAALFVNLVSLFFSFHTAYGSNNAAFQDNTIIVDRVSVEIWPEYDKPSVLVMYNITLASQVKLPANLVIRIPASAGQPNAVAAKDVNGLFNMQYQTAPAGDWIQVSFTTSTPDFRLEYYDPTLSKNNHIRSFTYHWPGDYTVNNLSIQVQQPVNANNMGFIPSIGSGRAGQDGLTYYDLLVGQVKAGTGFDLQLSYNKSDDLLTNAAASQAVRPSQPVNDQTPGRSTLNDKLPWAIAALGLVLIGLGAFWYWRASQSTTMPVPQDTSRAGKRHTSSSANAAKKEGERTEGIYCHQCGKRAASNDVFCRTCGTRLRVSE